MSDLNFDGPEEEQDVSQTQPDLILSPSDVSRIMRSNLSQTKFAKGEYREIAELLERLSIFERTIETKLRAWSHDAKSFESLRKHVHEGVFDARKRMHDILLSKHEYPAGTQLILMPSDAYAQNSFAEHSYRNLEMHNLAHCISVIACFEQELESYLTRQDGLDEPERQAMISDTLRHLFANKDHLTKILIGAYDKK